MNGLNSIKQDLLSVSNKDKAKLLSRFFKTGPGQYGEGDVFAGIVVPDIRKVVKKHRDMKFSDIVKLLHSREHEFRLTALLLLVYKYSKGSDEEKKKIYDIYLANTKWINNWDLVDLSAPHIIGGYLVSNNKEKKILERLARSSSLWERRIAVLATFAFIRSGDYKEVFKIAEMLLNDEHDLIHKAVGWMLRECGKRCGRDVEILFLEKHYREMPRTMLRYSIEHFSLKEKAKYMLRDKRSEFA